jgi:hypothetical protein
MKLASSWKCFFAFGFASALIACSIGHETKGAQPATASVDDAITVRPGSGPVQKWVLQKKPYGTKIVALDGTKKAIGTWLFSEASDGRASFTPMTKDTDEKLLRRLVVDMKGTQNAAIADVADELDIPADDGSPGCAQALAAVAIACAEALVEKGALASAACVLAISVAKSACGSAPTCNPNDCTSDCIGNNYAMGGQCITPNGSCTCKGVQCNSGACDSECRLAGNASGACYSSGCLCTPKSDVGGPSDPGTSSSSSGDLGGGQTCAPCDCYGVDSEYHGDVCGSTVEEITSACYGSC